MRQAKEAARSTGQPLVLPDIPSDAPGTSSKGAALRSRLPVQLDAGRLTEHLCKSPADIRTGTKAQSKVRVEDPCPKILC